MKLIVPFDTSISPPKRFWSALWKPGVQPENAETEFEIMRRSMVPGAPDVLLDSADRASAERLGAYARINRAFAAMGEWFARREAREDEEQSAASHALDELDRQRRLRSARRSRYFRM